MKLIKKNIRQYYKKNFKGKKIIPGKDLIPSSGKVFNDDELIKGVEAVLDGWWTEGRFALKLEKKLAKFIRLKNCFLTNSGSSANFLAVSALKSKKLGKRAINDGDEVITTAVNFPTTVNAILINNLVPVFIDVGLGDYNLKVDQLKKALSKKTRVVILAHTLGNPFNLDKVKSFCKKNNLWLIEDNCDALGSKYKKKLTGSFGDLSTLSFYPAHQMTTGEGGAVLTDDALLARIVMSLRDWGRDCWCKTGQNNACNKRFDWQFGSLPQGYDHKYIYSELGFNLKITDLQAAIGLAQFAKLKSFIKKRRKNFSYFYKNLSQFKNVFILPKWKKNSQPCWFGFPLTIKKEANFKRSDFLKYLSKKKIDSRLLFSGNILKQPYFINNNYQYRVVGSLENSDMVMNNSFWLGVYPALSKNHIDYVIKTIKQFLDES